MAKRIVAILSTSMMIVLFFSLNSPVKSDVQANQYAIQKIVFLGVKFQNDHESQEPTSEAERSRIKSLEDIFKSKLQETNRYKFLELPNEIKAKIEHGVIIGDCGGCEYDFGTDSAADISSWIVVQKVSNLILNINLYMADTKNRKISFSQSVDIRGNTDESWRRGMNYIINNHILKNN